MSDKYAPREGYGTFFLEPQPKSKDSLPDYKGTAMLDGKVWKLSMWKNSGTTNGRTWEKLTLKVDGFQQSNQRPTKREVSLDDSDVPF